MTSIISSVYSLEDRKLKTTPSTDVVGRWQKSWSERIKYQQTELTDSLRQGGGDQDARFKVRERCSKPLVMKERQTQPQWQIISHLLEWLLAKTQEITRVGELVEKMEMVGWHHWPEFEQALGDVEGQGGLGCCGPRGCKELDTTEGLNNTNNTHCWWECKLVQPLCNTVCRLLTKLKTEYCVT